MCIRNASGTSLRVKIVGESFPDRVYAAAGMKLRLDNYNLVSDFLEFPSSRKPREARAKYHHSLATRVPGNCGLRHCPAGAEGEMQPASHHSRPLQKLTTVNRHVVGIVAMTSCIGKT